MSDFRPYPVGTKVMVIGGGRVVRHTIGETGYVADHWMHHGVRAYMVDGVTNGPFFYSHAQLIPVTDPDTDVTLDAEPVTIVEPQEQTA